MATSELEQRRVSFDLLKKYGARWAVLAAMRLDLEKHGLRIGREVDEMLKLSRMEIMSGCFSPCDVGCRLSKVEGQLIAVGFSLGQDHLREWSDLLSQAMQGQIDLQRIGAIPALRPVQTDCKFLACGCS